MSILHLREEGSIRQPGRRIASGGWEEASIGRRQGYEYLVARREREEVAMGPAGRKKPLPID